MILPSQFHAGGCRGARARGFTLIEVMVASFVFFVVSFAVLDLTNRSLGSAKVLQKHILDPAMIAAELTITNRLEEGTVTGEFGDLYPDYTWEYTVEEVESNSLFRVDFVVLPRSGGAENAIRMSTLFFKPGSPPGRMSGGIKP